MNGTRSLARGRMCHNECDIYYMSRLHFEKWNKWDIYISFTMHAKINEGVMLSLFCPENDTFQPPNNLYNEFRFEKKEHCNKELLIYLKIKTRKIYFQKLNHEL